MGHQIQNTCGLKLCIICIMELQKPILSIFIIPLFILILIGNVTASCQRPTKITETISPTTPLSTDTVETSPTNTPTAMPTPAPLAAIVNDQAILLEDLNNEILRYMKAHPSTSAEQSFDKSLQSMIDQYLFAQEARNNGYSATEGMVTDRITVLINELGDETLFTQWLDTNHYTQESFERALAIAIETDYQIELIIQQIPDDIDQVELRQILVYDQVTADNIQLALESGTDFEWLARQYHPLTNGYLSWSPKGYLSQPAIEIVAFELESGTFSEMIETDFGFHFIKVLNHEIHPLSIDAKHKLQHLALQSWIDQQRSNSKIEIIASIQ